MLKWCMHLRSSDYMLLNLGFAVVLTSLGQLATAGVGCFKSDCYNDGQEPLSHRQPCKYSQGQQAPLEGLWDWGQFHISPACLGGSEWDGHR